MATTGKVSGDLIRFYIETDPTANPAVWVEAACATSQSWGIESEEIEARCKGDGKLRKSVPGKQTNTCEFEGVVQYENAINVDELFDLANSRATAQFRITTGVVGDPEITFLGWVKRFQETDPIDDIATYSVALSVNSDFTKTAIV